MPFTDEEWALARARLESMPENIGIASLRFGAISKDDVLSHIDAKDEIGELILKMQLNYLRALKG
jgi:hypothetical protein